MGLDGPGARQQSQAWFPEEKACAGYRERRRWPNRFHGSKFKSEKG
jgi:hypothetical protein